MRRPAAVALVMAMYWPHAAMSAQFPVDTNRACKPFSAQHGFTARNAAWAIPAIPLKQCAIKVEILGYVDRSFFSSFEEQVAAAPNVTSATASADVWGYGAEVALRPQASRWGLSASFFDESPQHFHQTFTAPTQDDPVSGHGRVRAMFLDTDLHYAVAGFGTPWTSRKSWVDLMLGPTYAWDDGCFDYYYMQPVNGVLTKVSSQTTRNESGFKFNAGAQLHLPVTRHIDVVTSLRYLTAGKSADADKAVRLSAGAGWRF